MLILAWLALVLLIGAEIYNDSKKIRNSAELLGNLIGLVLRYAVLYWSINTIMGI